MQVLETLAKRGLPSRAEITDAAMGERAECAMLSKGPHRLDAMQALDDILRRMQAHEHKQWPMLRRLHGRDGGSPGRDRPPLRARAPLPRAYAHLPTRCADTGAS